MTKSFKPLQSKFFASAAIVALAACANPTIANAQDADVAVAQAEAGASNNANHFGEDRYEIRFRAMKYLIQP